MSPKGTRNGYLFVVFPMFFSNAKKMLLKKCLGRFLGAAYPRGPRFSFGKLRFQLMRAFGEQRLFCFQKMVQMTHLGHTFW